MRYCGHVLAEIVWIKHHVRRIVKADHEEEKKMDTGCHSVTGKVLRLMKQLD